MAKKHDFRWTDAYRMLKRGLGVPTYRDNFHRMMDPLNSGPGAALRQPVIGTAAGNTYEAIQDYLAFILCIDLFKTFIEYAPRYYLYQGGISVAWAGLPANKRKNLGDVLRINTENVVNGLSQALAAIIESL